jgi:hypothetical protein
MTPAELLAPTVTEWGSSRASVLQRCRREYHLRYDRRLMPPERLTERAAYFDVGSYVHAGLRAVNETVMAGIEPIASDWGKVLDEARKQREASGTAPTPWDRIDPVDEAARLLEAYFGHYGYDNGGWPDSFKLVGAETLYAAPAAAGFEATTRADLELTRHGSRLFADTKTKDKSFPKDQAESDIALNYSVREQFLRTAALIQSAHGLPEPPSCIVDVIIKTKVPAFRRIPVTFTQKAVDAWRDNAARVEAIDSGLSDRMGPSGAAVMNYDACVNPITNKRCSYFFYCHGTDGDRADFQPRKDSPQ